MEWTAYDLSTKKTVIANLKYWFGDEFTNHHAFDVPSWDAILWALN